MSIVFKNRFDEKSNPWPPGGQVSVLAVKLPRLRLPFTPRVGCRRFVMPAANSLISMNAPVCVIELQNVNWMSFKELCNQSLLFGQFAGFLANHTFSSLLLLNEGVERAHIVVNIHENELLPKAWLSIETLVGGNHKATFINPNPWHSLFLIFFFFLNNALTYPHHTQGRLPVISPLSARLSSLSPQTHLTPQPPPNRITQFRWSYFISKLPVPDLPRVQQMPDQYYHHNNTKIPYHDFLLSKLRFTARACLSLSD